MKCIALLKRCRKCKAENSERSETCKECGENLHCTRDAVNGYTLCPDHGGPVPSRNFYGRGTMTNGSASSFPITRLAARYNRMKNDGVVLSNRAAVDIIDERIKQLLERVDVNESPERVKLLYETWQEYKSAKDAQRLTEAAMAEKALDELFERIFHDYQAWNQIFTALDLRGKTVEREIKAQKEIKAIMTVEDGYHLLAKALAAAMSVIGDDPKRIKQVQYEFSRIIGESSDHVTEGVFEDVGGGGEEGGGEARSGDMDQAEFLHPGDQE